MGILGILAGTREAVSLLSELSNILRKTSEEEDPNLRKVLIELHGTAGEVGRRLADRILATKNVLVDLRIDLKQTESIAGKNFTGLLDFRKRVQFRRATAEVDTLREELAIFVWDVEALLLCANKKTAMVEGTVGAHAVRRKLYELCSNDVSLQDQLDQMYTLTEEINEHLRPVFA